MAENEPPNDTVIIQFGNYCDRLVFISFLGRRREYQPPADTPFSQILHLLKLEWDATPFPMVIIQNPNTIRKLLREYHEYNLLPLPPAQQIAQKVRRSEQFYHFLTKRFAVIFPGCQLVPVEPTIDDYTHDPITGALLPPLGTLPPSEIHPSDLEYMVTLTPKAAPKRKNIPKVLRRTIKQRYPVHRIKCECCERWISCPSCDQKALLRGWKVGYRTVALCYGCGTIFFCDTGEILATCTGPRGAWGARAIALVTNL